MKVTRVLAAILLVSVVANVCNAKELARHKRDFLSGINDVLKTLGIGSGSSGSSSSSQTSSGSTGSSSSSGSNSGGSSGAGGLSGVLSSLGLPTPPPPPPPSTKGGSSGAAATTGAPAKPPPRTLPPPGALKVAYCKQNPADCLYLDCLAENFQHSEQVENIKTGGKILTNPQLRHELENNPQVSKAACDKIGLSDKGCNMFRSFLGVLDKLAPASNNQDNHDPNRGKRSPADSGILGTGVAAPVPAVHSNTNLNVAGNNASVHAAVGEPAHQKTTHSTPAPTTTTTVKTTTTTTAPASKAPVGPTGGGAAAGSGSGAGKGSGKSPDYTDIYDHGGSGHGSGQGGSGSGPLYVQRDCAAILKNANAKYGNGSSKAKASNNETRVHGKNGTHSGLHKGNNGTHGQGQGNNGNHGQGNNGNQGQGNNGNQGQGNNGNQGQGNNGNQGQGNNGNQGQGNNGNQGQGNNGNQGQGQGKVKNVENNRGD